MTTATNRTWRHWIWKIVAVCIAVPAIILAIELGLFDGKPEDSPPPKHNLIRPNATPRGTPKQAEETDEPEPSPEKRNPITTIFLDWANPPRPFDAKRDQEELSSSTHLNDSILQRELIRQAFLMTARDTFGLTTRDAVLREEPPKDLPPSNRFHLGGSTRPAESVKVVVSQGSPDRRKEIWKRHLEETKYDHTDILNVLAMTEAVSRKGYVNALKKAGFATKPNRVDPTLTVPDEVEQLLGTMEFTAQFRALRTLHDTIRQKGESPALLGALVRAYANLGVLTEWQWDSAHKVFKARALLYAQRMVVSDPENPWGWWHRAYAAGLTGQHWLALEDLQKADQLAASKKIARPAWCDLVAALCRFDPGSLDKVNRDDRLYSLARLLRFFTVESGLFGSRTIKEGFSLLDENPECYRVQQSLAQLGGSVYEMALRGAPVFEEWWPTRLAECERLPPAILKLLEGEATEPEVLAELIDSGSALDDHSEPSWTLLGRIAQENRFVFTFQWAYFYKFFVAVDLNEYLDEVEPLIAGHPYAALSALYRLDGSRQAAELERERDRLPLEDINRQARPLLWGIQPPGTNLPHHISIHAQISGRDSYQDVCQALWPIPLSKNAWQFGRDVIGISPHAPAIIRVLIASPNPIADRRRAEWEKLDQHPDILLGFLTIYLHEKRLDDAERCGLKAKELSADLVTFESLAEVYERQERYDRWQATLEEFLEKGEPAGLQRAQTRVKLANGLMKRGEFAKAEPFADKASESGAGWAMMCACRCAEGLEKWEKAEELVRGVSLRYPDSYADWYLWCERTGRGDQQAAFELLYNRLEDHGVNKSEIDLVNLVARHLLEGKDDKALVLLEEIARIYPKAHHATLLGSVLHEERGNARARDALLARAPKQGPISELSVEFRRAFKTGANADLQLDALEEQWKELDATSRVAIYYSVGRYLGTHGQMKEAIEYLKKASSIPLEGEHAYRTLTVDLLRKWEKK